MSLNRIFLGNLPVDISEEQIHENLRNFCTVSQLEVRRRVDHEGRATAAFAHLSMEMKKGATIKDCLKNLNRQKWGDFQLKAELAKETFHKRLESNNVEAKDTNLSPKKLPLGAELLDNPNKDIKKSLPTHQRKLGNGKKESGNSSDSDEEIYWKSSATNKAVVTIDDSTSPHKINGTKEFKKSPTKDLMSKFESFSSVWGDSVLDHFGASQFSYSDRPVKKFNISRSETSISTQSPAISPRQDIAAESTKSQHLIFKNHHTELKKKSFTKVNDNEKIPKKKSSETTALLNTDKESKTKNKDKILKKKECEEKRLKSVNERMLAIEKQQQTVRQALSGEPVNKKIKFNEEDSAMSPSTKESTGLQLFDSESDEEVGQTDFVVRQQFEGSKGQKLLELQSRFATDERFRLDERFAESDSEEDEQTKETGNDVHQEEREEKKRQLSIVDSILGPDAKVTARHVIKMQEKIKPVVRFDPLKPDHEKFVTTTTEVSKKKKKDKLQAEPCPEAEDKVSVPAVSEERFYEVSRSLKLSSATQSGTSAFSLRALFGNPEDDANDADNHNRGSKEIIQPEKTIKKVKNPLEECDEENNVVFSTEDTILESTSTWQETFFFRENDPRFREAVEFFQSSKNESPDAFRERRKSLWVAVKSKARNVAKKKTSFKQKLGSRSFRLKKFGNRNQKNSNK